MPREFTSEARTQASWWPAQLSSWLLADLQIEVVPNLIQIEGKGKAGLALGPHSLWTIPIASTSKLTFFPSCPYFLVGQFLFLSQVTARLTRRFNSHRS